MILLQLFRSRRIDVCSHWGFLREREFRRLSSIFGSARKYGSAWIGQVILIGWKYSATLTVKLNYAPNKNSSFFLLHIFPMDTSPKVNVIVWMEFELAYFEAVVLHINRYATGSSSCNLFVYLLYTTGGVKEGKYFLKGSMVYRFELA